MYTLGLFGAHAESPQVSNDAWYRVIRRVVLNLPTF